MFHRLLLLFLSFPTITLSLRILVYSPVFGYSHSNFLGKVADTLTERGHNVTFLAPVIDASKKDECRGVKLTKDLIYVERNDEEMGGEGSDKDGEDDDALFGQEMIENLWLVKMDSSNVAETEDYFSAPMENACRTLHSNMQLFTTLKSQNFDLFILEPISTCGLGYAAALGITKTILIATCPFYDNILEYIGEPFDYSSVPGSFGASGDRMTMAEKWENWRMSSEVKRVNDASFERQMEIYREYHGAHLPHWKELFASASLHFINSNPYLDFPRPMLQKTVSIGGLSVNFDWIKEQKLTEEWDKVLGQRRWTMLISFGTMLKSMYMPGMWRDGLLRAIRNNPNVTFIWKYESADTSFASDTPNIHFSPWLPQTSLLNDPRLTAFLTHAGLGSTFELAYCAKPALMVPLFYDQFRNANMMVRHGMALTLKTEDLEDWRVVDERIKAIVYEEKYTRSARRVAEMLKNQPMTPGETLIRYTEFVGRYGPFPQMDPYSRQLTGFQKQFLDIYSILLAIGTLGIILIIGTFKVLKLLYDHRKNKCE